MRRTMGSCADIFSGDPKLYSSDPQDASRLRSAPYAEGWQSPAYCTGLENRQGVKTLAGSNPAPSAYLQVFLFGSPVNRSQANPRGILAVPFRAVVCIPVGYRLADALSLAGEVSADIVIAKGRPTKVGIRDPTASQDTRLDQGCTRKSGRADFQPRAP
jgi:hypothetical protein